MNEERTLTEAQSFTSGLIHQLRKKGYDCTLKGNDIDISKNGLHIMSLMPNGDYKPAKTAINECVYEVRGIRQTIKEAYDNYFNGESLEYEKLTHYRKFAQFNGVMLAARMDADGLLDFVTWRQTHGNTGVETGNYFADNYEAAKEDFTTRAGLVNRLKMFSETELKLIHQGLVHFGADFSQLTVQQMMSVGKIIEKVEIIVPAIQARSIHEAHELVPEDGLEV